jgi:hypothetical protein
MLHVCNARRRRLLWRLDQIRSRGGDASTTTPTMFIYTFPLCDLQGFVDLIFLARYFASRRSDLGSLLFIIVGKKLFSMLQNPLRIFISYELNRSKTSPNASIISSIMHAMLAKI